MKPFDYLKGSSKNSVKIVTPAQARVQESRSTTFCGSWMPVFTGMTEFFESSINILKGRTLPVWHKASKPGIFLTFDDGPSPELTPLLLDILAQAHIKASFFLCGQRAELLPELCQRIAKEGHGLFSHFYSHRNLEDLSPAEIPQELNKTEQILGQFRPRPSPYLLRLPFGRGWKKAKIHRAIKSFAQDAVIVQWSKDFQDWALKTEEIDRVLAQDYAFGDILLLHDLPWDAGADYDLNLAPVLLSKLIARIEEKGYPWGNLRAIDE